jgi:putative CocE/NonD family hydrolase
MNDLHRQWYDWTMKSGAKPEFLKKAVAYYMIGPEQWRYADTLAGVTRAVQPWFLASQNGKANDVFASGSLVADAGGDSAPDAYVYDPLDTTPARFSDRMDVPELTDQRPVLDNKGGSLVYHTPPFADDTELGGFPTFSAWIALDQPDTDIDVELYEIKPDGGSVFLTGDRMRARYREGLRAAKPVPKGEVLRYEFDGFTFVARRIDKGSRLRLLVQPINSPFWQKNYNSGGEVSDETAKDARTVTVTLYHDAAHPSALHIPLAAKE